METLRVTPVARSGAERCPFCFDGLGWRVWTCSGCRAEHHHDCVRAHGRCAVFGCGTFFRERDRPIRSFRRHAEDSTPSFFVGVLGWIGGIMTAAVSLLSFPVILIEELGHPDFQSVALPSVAVAWLVLGVATSRLSRREVLAGVVGLFLVAHVASSYCWDGTRSYGQFDGKCHHSTRAIDDHVTRRIQ